MASEGKVGRKEVLTEALARSICKMIERMPDADIPVTWQNVMAHCEKRFGQPFNRQTLSQKQWAGRKLIGEAFTEAQRVAARKKNDSTPRYKTAPRAVLQKKIADQAAKIMALQDELEKVRAQQIHVLDAFVNTRLDLRKLFQESLNEE